METQYANIKFEQAIVGTMERQFQAALLLLLSCKAYLDVREYLDDINNYLHLTGLENHYTAGSGGNHVWIHRVGDANRWAFITAK